MPSEAEAGPALDSQASLIKLQVPRARASMPRFLVQSAALGIWSAVSMDRQTRRYGIDEAYGRGCKTGLLPGAVREFSI